jgi:rhamnose utilization protein RhaD (predicted bifunctional aldolase and dehydrogenase)
MRDRIERLSEAVGSDPALIQAAGGNVSWKDGGTLWVKSSGAWLANARTEDMFVPVDLEGVRGLIAEGRENYMDYRIGGSTLRPSIETALHALMPQRIVVHLHAIDAIALAVRIDGEEQFERRLQGLAWMWVAYHKPGAALASAIAQGLSQAGVVPDVLVLANHGIVFCGADVAEVEDRYRRVLQRLRVEARVVAGRPDRLAAPALSGYDLSESLDARSLAFDPVNLELARERWVIYPDHAVFLGPAARIYQTIEEARSAIAIETAAERLQRPVVIVPEVGVWLASAASKAAIAMLDCYAHVCRRLTSANTVRSLRDDEVSALLNWEAEAFRKKLAH